MVTTRVSKKKKTEVKDKRRPGRPAGSKDAFPRGVKSTFRAVCEEIQTKHGRTILEAMVAGIEGGPAYADKYLKLFRDSIDGPPAMTSNINASFKEDEIAAAQKELDRKMTALFNARVKVDDAG